MARHLGLLVAAVLAIGAAAPRAGGAEVFHANFNEGTGNPSGTYLGSPLAGSLLDPSVGYSGSINPFAAAGTSSLFLPGTTNGHAAQFNPPAEQPLNGVDFSSGTIAAWINVSSFAGNGGGHRIFTTRQGGGNSAFDFYIYSPAHGSRGGWLELHAGTGPGANTQFNTGGQVFNNDDLGKWFFVAVTWNSATDEMYFYKGDESGTLNQVASWGSAFNIQTTQHGSIRIGGGAFGGNTFNGMIDNFYLSNDFTTQSQLQQLMVPEPAGAALAGLGLSLMALRRRKQGSR